MLNKIKQIIGQDGSQQSSRRYSYAARTFRPEQPLGFVPRTDPNFYFLSKR
jgi:hypothetical protein